jgi:hypothetical protein
MSSKNIVPLESVRRFPRICRGRGHTRLGLGGQTAHRALAGPQSLLWIGRQVALNNNIGAQKLSRALQSFVSVPDVLYVDPSEAILALISVARCRLPRDYRRYRCALAGVQETNDLVDSVSTLLLSRKLRRDRVRKNALFQGNRFHRPFGPAYTECFSAHRSKKKLDFRSSENPADTDFAYVDRRWARFVRSHIRPPGLFPSGEKFELIEEQVHLSPAKISAFLIASAAHGSRHSIEESFSGVDEYRHADLAVALAPLLDTVLSQAADSEQVFVSDLDWRHMPPLSSRPGFSGESLVRSFPFFFYFLFSLS